MAKQKAKIAIKIKGNIHQVKKALSSLAQTGAADSAPILREADFRTKNKKKI